VPIDAQDDSGRTALMQAVNTGPYYIIYPQPTVEVVKLLLKRGADVKIKAKSGATALSLAIQPEIKSLLVKAGAKK
jgi:ankyrin repeat protein